MKTEADLKIVLLMNHERSVDDAVNSGHWKIRVPVQALQFRTAG